MEFLSSLGGRTATHLTDLGLGKEQPGWINLVGAALAIFHHVDEMAAIVILKIFSQKKSEQLNERINIVKIF